MKLLKSAPPALLALIFALLLSVPALALEDELPEEEPVSAVVNTLDELLDAIGLAENGDTIILQKEIIILENCIIGQEEKHITIIPADDFVGDIMLEVWTWEEQNVVLQNIILDGQSKSNLSAIQANFYNAPNDKGTIHLKNIQVRNFISDHSNIYLKDISAIIDDCQFLDNTARRTAGVEIASNSTAKISDCVFSGNTSLGSGGALQCQGQVQIESTTITQNKAVNSDTAVMGGGIHIGQQAYCEIKGCHISDNTAHLGGGIANLGNAVVIDTVLCKNQGLNGASDIQTFSSEQFSVTYSDGMKSIYSENDPIGFYLDDMDNRFDPESNAVFLGESLARDITMTRYGAKFVFASDLPQEPPEEAESPNERDTPVEPPTETDPLEPTMPDTDELPEADKSDEDATVPATPSVPSTPSTPPTTSKPSRPNVQEPPVIQPEEPPKLELSCGGAILDTAIPLTLLGYEDGQLHENDLVTRAQIAVLLYRSLTENSKSYIADTCAFADVANGAWYYDAVAVLSSAGVIIGCDGLFRPNDALTFGEFLTILTRFVEPKETPMPDSLPYREHWAYASIVTAIACGWIDNAAKIDPNRTLTRGEAVGIVNSIFEGLQVD